MRVFRKNRVAFWRKVRGITQEDLARKLGVTRRTLTRWEQGDAIPSPERAKELARLLAVDPRLLFPFEIIQGS